MADFNGHRTQKRGLKQQNKKHNTGKHRSKGALADASQGRIESNTGRKALKGGKSAHAVERRKVKLNHAKQMRDAKRTATFNHKRGSGDAPHLIAVVGLCGGATDAAAVCHGLVPPDTETTVDGPYVTFTPANIKKKITLAATSGDNVMATMQLAAAADTVIFVLSAEAAVDEFGELAIKCLRSQGLAAVSHLTIGLDSVPVKRRGDAKKALTKQAEEQFPDSKVLHMEGSKDAAAVLWAAVNQKRKDVRWREIRPYMLAHEVDFAPSATQEADGQPVGTMAIRAYVRGKDLDVNRLVYLPGGGAYQIERIVTGDVAGKVSAATAMAEDDGSAAADAIFPLPELQETLESEVPLDPFEGEQSLITDEEIAESQAATQAGLGEVEPKLYKVPKGTSSYQAAWIANSDDEEDEGEDDDEEDGMGAEQAGATEDDLAGPPEPSGGGKGVKWADLAGLAGASSIANPEEEMDLVSLDGHGTFSAEKYDSTVDGEEDAAMAEQMRLAREDQQYPDEVDTPFDKPAKVRFQKYRGLASFRHSQWDTREELPAEFGRIFQFQRFRQTVKRVLAENEPEEGFGVEPGTFVTLYIANVPTVVAEQWATITPECPLTVYGLLPHENRMSVLNFKLKTVSGYDTPIRSKERLVFYTGLRQFSACPIFSQHSIGDKHKFEKYLQPGSNSFATIFAPIHFPPMPMLMFRREASGKLELAAVGNLASVNPDRMVIKRIRLAGHVFKVNKRTAVLRYMFHTPEDIHWFKPVELTSKMGLRGHIKESLGTHGHMKCTFDGQISHQDTIFMNLYKRIYPKWTYAELLEGGF